MLIVLVLICVAAVIALGLGLYSVGTGRFPVRVGTLKELGQGLPARIVGFDLILWSALLAYLAWGTDQLRRDILLPPQLMRVHFFATPLVTFCLVAILQYALWLSRRSGRTG